jgi:hypothetical protein
VNEEKEFRHRGHRESAEKKFCFPLLSDLLSHSASSVVFSLLFADPVLINRYYFRISSYNSLSIDVSPAAADEEARGSARVFALYLAQGRLLAGMILIHDRAGRSL